MVFVEERGRQVGERLSPVGEWEVGLEFESASKLARQAVGISRAAAAGMLWNDVGAGTFGMAVLFDPANIVHLSLDPNMVSLLHSITRLLSDSHILSLAPHTRITTEPS